MLKRIAVFLIAALVAAGALAQGKKRIEKATDMPTFTYRMDGKLEDLVRELSVGQGPGDLERTDHQGEDAERLHAC